jgi:hypothetical protein
MIRVVDQFKPLGAVVALDFPVRVYVHAALEGGVVRQIVFVDLVYKVQVIG